MEELIGKRVSWTKMVSMREQGDLYLSSHPQKRQGTVIEIKGEDVLVERDNKEREWVHSSNLSLERCKHNFMARYIVGEDQQDIQSGYHCTKCSVIVHNDDIEMLLDEYFDEYKKKHDVLINTEKEN